MPKYYDFKGDRITKDKASVLKTQKKQKYPWLQDKTTWQYYKQRKANKYNLGYATKSQNLEYHKGIAYDRSHSTHKRQQRYNQSQYKQRVISINRDIAKNRLRNTLFKQARAKNNGPRKRMWQNYDKTGFW